MLNGILSGMKWCSIAQKAIPSAKLSPKLSMLTFCYGGCVCCMCGLREQKWTSCKGTGCECVEAGKGRHKFQADVPI